MGRLRFSSENRLKNHMTTLSCLCSGSECESLDCRPPGQLMEEADRSGAGYPRGSQGDTYRSRGQLQRHHTIQTCDDAYVSQRGALTSTVLPPAASECNKLQISCAPSC